MKLQISDNKRFLQSADKAPFFFLGDTAWELFHRLTREEADFYLQTRAAQGFNVIQAVVLAEFDGLRIPNALGEVPLHDLDPTKPNEAYFQHVDYIVDKAESLGLFVGLLPTWGDKWNLAWGVQFGGLEVFTPENAAVYGEWLGRRYAQKPIIWILGGDRAVENATHREIIQAMSQGLTRGDGGAHLQTFHPPGGRSSSEYFHDAAWLDFHMLQTGHASRDVPSYDKIAHDLALQPPKPVLDGEPRYENHPVMGQSWKWNGENWFDERDVRIAAYHAVFAGACGHTYGCHDIWQMFDAQREAVNNARTPWKEALFLPGATQMQHLKTLMESRPYFGRVPDQTLIASEQGEGRHRIQATRDADGFYAFIYIPGGQNVTINASKLNGENLVASWFDPRSGTMQKFDEMSRNEPFAVTPPTDEDWVLVLDVQG